MVVRRGDQELLWLVFFICLFMFPRRLLWFFFSLDSGWLYFNGLLIFVFVLVLADLVSL